MEVSTIANLMKLSNEKLIRKAEEFVRLAAIRCPGGLGTSEICKGAVCLDLAASTLAISGLDRDLCIQYSGADEKTYKMAYSSLQTILKIQNIVTVQDLASQFELNSVGEKGDSSSNIIRLVKPSQKLLNLYKEKFLEGIPEEQRTYADFSSPVFPAVAFYLTSKLFKVSLDKKKVIRVSMCTSADFEKVYESMIELCDLKHKAPSSPTKSKKAATKTKENRETNQTNKEKDSKNDKDKNQETSTTKKTKKRKLPSINDEPSKKKRKQKLNDVLILRKEKKESDEESDLSGEEIAEGIEVPNLHKSKKRRKREEFSQWKEKVLQENLSEKTKDVNSKSLKQTTLQFSSQEKKETDTLFDDD